VPRGLPITVSTSLSNTLCLTFARRTLYLKTQYAWFAAYALLLLVNKRPPPRIAAT